LRNEIYCLAVIVETNIAAEKQRSRDDAATTDTVTIAKPGLLSVNRQIRSEAGAIFFRENTFAIASSAKGVAEVLLHNIVRHILMLVLL